MDGAANEKNRERRSAQKKESGGTKHFYRANIILIIIIAVVFIIIFLLVFCKVGYRSFEGNTIYSDKELSDMLFTEDFDENTFVSWFMNAVKPKKGIAFVKKVDIIPTGLDSVNVVVHQKDLYGRIPVDTPNGKYFIYYDKDLNVSEVSKKDIDGIFIVTLPALEAEPVVGEPIPYDMNTRKALSLLQEELAARGISVDNADINDEGSVTVWHGPVEIRLGLKENLKEKIMRLPYILPQVENMPGTLHLEDWTQENTDIVFEKS